MKDIMKNPRVVKKVLKLKLNPEGQGRQPPTDQPQPPAASHQPPAAAASRLHTTVHSRLHT